MGTTVGAVSQSGNSFTDDPVLAGALSELSAEGVNLEGTGDPGGETAGAGASVSSATPVAAPPAPSDDGKGTAGTIEGQAVAGKTVVAGTTAGSVQAPAAGQAAAEEDPLKGTEPFTYTVNGETKTLEGVLRVPGEGLLVPEDKVFHLQRLAEERDTLDRVSREYQTRNADYERLSAWTTKAPDGSDQSLKGTDALVAMRVAIGRTAAENEAFRAVLSDPQRILSLLAQTPDGKFVIDPQALETLDLRIDKSTRDTEDAIRSFLSTSVSRSPTATAAPSSPSAPADLSTQAPAIIENAAKQFGLDAKVLTEKDRSFLAQALPRYVRTVTEEDRRFNPALKVGGPIVDASYSAVVKHMHEERSSSIAAAKAAETAGKHNAGMDKGRQPAKVAAKPAAPAKPSDAKPSGRQKPDWDTPLATALQEMDIAR